MASLETFHESRLIFLPLLYQVPRVKPRPQVAVSAEKLAFSMRRMKQEIKDMSPTPVELHKVGILVFLSFLDSIIIIQQV